MGARDQQDGPWAAHYAHIGGIGWRERIRHNDKKKNSLELAKHCKMMALKWTCHPKLDKSLSSILIPLSEKLCEMN